MDYDPEPRPDEHAGTERTIEGPDARYDTMEAFDRYLDRWEDARNRTYPDRFDAVDPPDRVSGRMTASYAQAMEEIAAADAVAMVEPEVLLSAHDHQDAERALGAFMSALYNTAGSGELTFDPETDATVARLGYDLPEDGCIRNRTTVERLGEAASGTIINEGEAEAVGWYSDDLLVVNEGTVASPLQSDGIFINRGHVEQAQDSNQKPGPALLINAGSYDSEFAGLMPGTYIDIGTSAEQGPDYDRLIEKAGWDHPDDAMAPAPQPHLFIDQDDLSEVVVGDDRIEPGQEHRELLEAYLGELEDDIRGRDASELSDYLDTMGSDPAAAIRDDIIGILDGGGS